MLNVIKWTGRILLIILTALLLLSALSAHFTFNPPASVATVSFRMFLQMTLKIQIIAVPIIAALYIGYSVFLRHGKPIGKISAICVAVLPVGFALNLITMISLFSSEAKKSGLDYSAVNAGENRKAYQLSTEIDYSDKFDMEQCKVFFDKQSEYKNIALIYLNYGGRSVQGESFGEQIKDFCRKEGYTFVRFGVTRKVDENIAALTAEINEKLSLPESESGCEKFILCGGSAGGHLALLCGKKDGNDPDFPTAKIKADGIIALYPCVDPAYTYDYFVNSEGNGILDKLGDAIYCGVYNGESGTLAGETKKLDEAIFGIRSDVNSLYEKTSIANLLDNDVPFLVVHGEKDTMMPIAASENLFEAAKNSGQQAALLKLYGTEHVFDMTKTAAWDRCEKEMTGFLREIVG